MNLGIIAMSVLKLLLISTNIISHLMNIMHIIGKMHQNNGGQFAYLCELTLAFSRRLCYTISNKNKRRFLPWLTSKK